MATEVFFSNNPADWEKLEALYIAETDPPGFIRGVDLSVVAMAGLCVRGPESVQRITSTARFLEIYGARDYGSGGTLVGEIWKALLNKPFGTLVVRRVVASDAVAGSVDLDDVVPDTIVTVNASSKGAWSLAANNGPTVSVEAATDGDANKFNLLVKYLGGETLYENISAQAGSTQEDIDAIIGDDVGNLITITKVADGRPLDIADEPLTAGADGTLAAADYTAAVTTLANTPNVAVVMVPESLEDTIGAGEQATLHGTLVTLAPTVADRIFLTWSGIAGQTPAQEITDLAADITTLSDRIVWCYNDTVTLDPDTSVGITQGPHVWMASILSQNDVDVHPGALETSDQTAGIRELGNEALTRNDLIDLRAAGISTLEKLSDGFRFKSGKVTLLTTGKTEITRRRSADFLQLSAADRLKAFVKQKNTVEKRAQMTGEIIAFSDELKDNERVIEDFSVTTEGVNTAAQRARGLEKIRWDVRLIGHILHLVLETEIGTGVVIESA